MQSDFISGDSTVNQHVDIYNTFCKALDEDKEVRATFCDISKDFDRVWHKVLLFKLRKAGINGELLDLLSNDLTNRKQRVVIPGAVSNWAFIKPVSRMDLFLALFYFFYI